MSEPLAPGAAETPDAQPAPIDVTLNGDPRSIAARTLGEMLAALALDPRTVAVEHNGTVVRRALLAETPIAAGDRVEVVRFVQGG